MKKYLIIYRPTGGGRMRSDIRDEHDFHLHYNFRIIRKYEVNDDGDLTEVTV